MLSDTSKGKEMEIPVPDVIVDTSHHVLSKRDDYYGGKYRGFVIAGLNMDPEYRKDKLSSYKIRLHEIILEYNRLLMIYSGIKYADEHGGVPTE